MGQDNYVAAYWSMMGQLVFDKEVWSVFDSMYENYDSEFDYVQAYKVGRVAIKKVIRDYENHYTEDEIRFTFDYFWLKHLRNALEDGARTLERTSAMPNYRYLSDESHHRFRHGKKRPALRRYHKPKGHWKCKDAAYYEYEDRWESFCKVSKSWKDQSKRKHQYKRVAEF